MFGKENRFDYFKAFARQAEFACEEAALLVRILENYDPKQLRDQLEEAHVIEHGGDQVNHQIFKSLATEFVAPLEREDISDLAGDLDGIIDSIEDVPQLLYMFDAKDVPERAIEMAHTINKACNELREALDDFPHFKRSPAVRDHLIEVNTLEEQGDLIFLRGVRELFTDHKDDPLYVIAWDNIYAKLEKCCDACEHVADVIQTIVMKNS